MNLTRVPLTILPTALQLALEVFLRVESLATSISNAYLSVKPSGLLIYEAENRTLEAYWTHSEKNKEFEDWKANLPPAWQYLTLKIDFMWI